MKFFYLLLLISIAHTFSDIESDVEFDERICIEIFYESQEEDSKDFLLDTLAPVISIPEIHRIA